MAEKAAQTGILAIDQGTSGTKAVVFTAEGSIAAQHTAPLSCSYPREGYVEQEPAEILRSVKNAVSACLERFRRQYPGAPVSCCGISNQRETFLLWDETGTPITPAIVWQCKRSIPICSELKERGLEPWIQEKTGLIIDPYFSGTKLLWEYRNNRRVRKAVDAGRAYFGTVDTWLLYALTGGAVYATDHTNASRTMLFNIRSLKWDREILEEFSLSALNLPEPAPSAHHYGDTALFDLLPEPIPVGALIGDSHAAAVGENVFGKGDLKATLGTGSSILMNIGSEPAPPAPGVVSTICFSLKDRVDYALEGIIVSCGSTITWLKEQLKAAEDEHAITEYAESIDGNHGVYFIPAFSGIGAPYWKMDAKAAIMGLTFGTGIREISRATLESIGYQLRDALADMEAKSGVTPGSLRFDGGIIRNRFVMQHIADLLEKPASAIGMPEVSALGAAYLAGITGGHYGGLEELKGKHSYDAVYRPASEREKLDQVRSDYEAWKMYIDRLL
jgi:glycerol kinase